MIINGQRLLELEPIKNMCKEKFTIHGTSFGLSEAGYDIRIKQNVHFRPHTKMSIGMQVFVADKEPFKVQFMSTGRFCLASAIEEFQMPNNLLGVVHDKSTWARKGLSVFNTVIEPGWKGFLTLELVYNGEKALYIPAGSGIAQVLFHEVAEPAQYVGKYQNQEDMPVPARESL